MPMATGMSLAMCIITLKSKRPSSAKYVLWSRIDQKSCFKSMMVASVEPIVIDTKRNPQTNGLETDIKKFEETILELSAANIVCIFSTTSCFAPRESDDIVSLAKLAAKYDIPHLINNAYGLQSTDLCRSIQKAGNGPTGRVDLFVQSTDKNLMVPVGGAIVCGFDANAVENVANLYAGRASGSQAIDVLITLLSLGMTGYQDYLEKRERNFRLLKNGVEQLYKELTLGVVSDFIAIRNQISVGFPLKIFYDYGGQIETGEIGSMLFTRGVSGARLVKPATDNTVEGFHFNGWGGHTSDISAPYLTAAVGLGCEEYEIHNFLSKLRKILQCGRNFRSQGTECK